MRVIINALSTMSMTHHLPSLNKWKKTASLRRCSPRFHRDFTFAKKLWSCEICTWVFPKNRGTPKWMVYNGTPWKTLLKWMIWIDLGVPLFSETSTWKIHSQQIDAHLVFQLLHFIFLFVNHFLWCSGLCCSFLFPGITDLLWGLPWVENRIWCTWKTGKGMS